MKRGEVRGAERKRERERERSAHESQEVVVIVTEYLYLSIRALSGISLLWEKKHQKKKKISHTRARAVSLRQKLSANAHALILATCELID